MQAMNGCYNRNPLATHAIVQDGWVTKGFTRLPHMIKVVDPMSKKCNYIQHTKDPKCEGCKHGNH